MLLDRFCEVKHNFDDELVVLLEKSTPKFVFDEETVFNKGVIQ